MSKEQIQGFKYQPRIKISVEEFKLENPLKRVGPVELDEDADECEENADDDDEDGGQGALVHHSDAGDDNQSDKD